MWCVPIADVSIGAVGQVRASTCKLYESLHPPGSPQAGGEGPWAVPWKEIPLPWPCFYCILQDNRLVNIVLCFKEDAVKLVASPRKLGPSKVSTRLPPKRLLLPKLVGSRGHIRDRRGATLATPFVLHGFAIICKDYTPWMQLSMRSCPKGTASILMGAIERVRVVVALKRPG